MFQESPEGGLRYLTTFFGGGRGKKETIISSFNTENA